METAKEIYTIEIRDGRGIPCVQARVDAENPIEALILAPQAGDPVEWVFLREVSYGELDSMLGYPTDSENDTLQARPRR
jgi:hypothetical protein